jgi:hypothetical protein
MPDRIDAARKLIAARLDEIEAEAKRLEAALAGLGERAASGPAVRSPARKKKRVTKPRRRRKAKAPRGRRREQLLAAIAANPGARPAELAGVLGIGPSQASALIAKARAENLVVKKGAGYALKK